MSLLQNSNAIEAGGNYTISNSLRFRSSASAYLSRTPASAGNQKTWTWSGWVKRGSLGTRGGLFGSVDTYIEFIASDILEINLRAAATNYIWTTTQVFRDPSAWYHIVLAVDTTQATATDRMKLYVNGSQVTSFAATATIPQNTDTRVNSTALHTIGSYNATTDYLDGYQAEINFVNAQQLTPSSFGAANADTGVWRPKAYTGTYGTNGFYLKFTDVATTSGSNAGLGKDFSGNGNYWTTNNISVTSGVTYDAMTDVPTLTSATAGNYATLNPIDNASGTISNGNLLFTGPSGQAWARSNIPFPTTGKWYVEASQQSSATTTTWVGLASESLTPSTTAISTSSGTLLYSVNGTKTINGTNSAYGATWYVNTDVIGIAYDADAGTLTMYKNGTSQGTLATGISGVYYLCVVDSNATNARALVVNFGQQPFTYTPPTGYVALNTYNLPTSTILAGNKYMDATLWTGTGASNSITNAGSFKPDLVWIKSRASATGNHNVYDSVRGVTLEIDTNLTAAETTTAQGLTAFNSNGFTVGTNTGVNGSGATLVGWQWQAGQGSTSSNTSGSITSTVSVNTSAGFSIVTYTGTGANATVGHGLGVAPSLIIIKSRSIVQDWQVYHVSLGNTSYVQLDTTGASASNVNRWNNTSPTSSVFTIGTAASLNTSAATYVAYCWAEIAGFSKFGSYTGNGNADGTFVYTGFRPKYVMVKKTNASGQWSITDSMRSSTNVTGARLQASTAVIESSAEAFDFLSNGFKLRATSADSNASSDTYIYMAFAENPFKYSNAR